MTLWMLVDTRTPEQLPLAVADTCTELAKIAGTTKNNILSSICHSSERDTKKTRYLKIEVDD